jgi:hypothetical protein
MQLSGTQDYIASNDWMAVNNDMERMLKEGVVAYFKLLFCYLSEGTKEKKKNVSRDIPCPSPDSNCSPPEFKGNALRESTNIVYSIFRMCACLVTFVSTDTLS